MTVGQNKRKSSLRLDQRSMNEIERRLSALEGLAQQTMRYGTKIRNVRQSAIADTDLIRKAEWTINGETGNLVILDANGRLVDSGYSPTELLAMVGGGDTAVSAISAYKANYVQQIEDQLWTAIQFSGEIYDIQGEFTIDTNFWTEVAPQAGAETFLGATVILNSEIYAAGAANGELYKWNGVDDWTKVADQLGAQVIQSLYVYDGKIYGGTSPLGKLYEWNGTDAWVEVAPQLGAETHIYSLCEFNDKLYGGTFPNGNLYEWNGTNAWVQKAPKLAAETYIYSLCEFDGKLYGGTGSLGNLYEWNGVNAWVQKAVQLNAQTRILSLIDFEDEFYGSTYGNGKLFKWNGVNAWTEVADQFGGQTYIWKLIEYNGAIYGGTRENGYLLMWNGSDAWVQKATQLSETRILGLCILNEKIYGSTSANGKLYEWDGTDCKFTADKLGKYSVHATVEFTDTNIAADKQVMAAIYKNGSEIARSIVQTSHADTISVSVQTETEITVGGYIEIYTWHNMGDVCEIDYGSEKTHFEIHRIDN